MWSFWIVTGRARQLGSSQTDDTPCDDTVMNWLHTLHGDRFEMATTPLFCHLGVTILDPGRSRIVSLEFVDNPLPRLSRRGQR
jgi:hypothetical protein